MGSFTSHRVMNIEGLWGRAYGLSSLSSLQRWHCLLSYWKTGVLIPRPPRIVVICPAHWANWSAIIFVPRARFSSGGLRPHPKQKSANHGFAYDITEETGHSVFALPEKVQLNKFTYLTQVLCLHVLENYTTFLEEVDLGFTNGLGKYSGPLTIYWQ